jgi:serine O-acetyltransferase
MFNVVSFYRLANLLYRCHVPLVPKMIDILIRLVFCCWLPHNANLGRKIVLGYGGLGVVIHADAKIGDDVHIDQCVTIGGNGTKFGVPTIESKVYIGAGAKILGPITVGFGSVIGANAVVTKDIQARSVAIGVPAKIVRANIDVDDFLYHRRIIAR